MRIATWNLERPKAGTTAANAARLAQVEAIGADIWVLTETSAAVTPNGYSSFASPPQPNYHAAGESSVTVHSKFPILSQLPTWNPHLSICIEMKSPLGLTLVYGTIITYANYRGADGTSKRWVEHRKALRAQIDDWSGLRTTRPQHTLVIAGDFNQSRDGSGWYEDAESVAALSKSLEELDVRCLTEEDFRAKFSLDRANIDHICVSARSCLGAVKVGAWPGTKDGMRMSDHNGVYVDVDA